MGWPLMSRYSSGSTLGPLSMALPEPSKIRPSMSSDTPSFKLWPVNSTLVYSCVSKHVAREPRMCPTFFTSIPGVPSKTYNSY